MKMLKGIDKKSFWLAVVLSALGGVFTTVKLLFNGPGWGDEFLFSDKAINIALYGQPVSTLWTDCQVDLFYRLLVGWLKIFGVSHLTVCSFEVLFCAISGVFICAMALKRGVFKGSTAVVLFNCLYWGGANFMWTMMSGRLDGITLFFSVVLIMLLMMRCENSCLYLGSLFCGTFLLFMISIYTVPLIGLFGVLLWLWPQDEISRKQMFARGLVCVVGLSFAFALVLILQFYHHTLLRYVYLLFHHCTVVSGDHNGSTVGFPACYLEEPWMIVMAACSVLLLFLFARQKACWGYVVFVVLIPLLMVGIGRYAYYYHWLFFVPLTVLFVCAVDASVCPRFGVPIVCVGVLAFTIVQVKWVVSKYPAQYKAEQEEFVSLLKKNSDVYRPGDDVIIPNEINYYPAISLRLRPWHKPTKHLNNMMHTTNERMDEMLARKIKDAKLRRRVADFMEKYERTAPKLPVRGLLVVNDDGRDDRLVEALKGLGFSVEFIDHGRTLRLCRISRSQTHEDQ